jgi:CheY-like chemotaxis protein
MKDGRTHDGTTPGRRVLVIDDDATIVGLIKTVLSDEGYDVAGALHGQQALRLDGPPPDLVVLDMYIPGLLSGASLADALRAKYDRDLPILVMSASNVAKEAKALGAVSYLAKPFDLVALLEAIRLALSASR